jgi:hypothetical protein
MHFKDMSAPLELSFTIMSAEVLTSSVGWDGKNLDILEACQSTSGSDRAGMTGYVGCNWMLRGTAFRSQQLPAS